MIQLILPSTVVYRVVAVVPMTLAVRHPPPAPVLDLGLGMWGILSLTSSPGWTLDPYGSYPLELKVMSLRVWWQKNGEFEIGQTRCKQTIIIYSRSVFYIFVAYTMFTLGVFTQYH
jgi:hypothetical protein